MRDARLRMSAGEATAHWDSTVYGFKTPSYKEINGQLDNSEAFSSCSDRRNGPKRSD